MFNEDWEPRIGREAAQTLKSAYQYIRLFFVVWAVVLVIAVAAMLSRTMPLWFSVLGTAAVVALLSVAVLAFGTFSIRRKRAGRQAWEYLGRPPQCLAAKNPAVRTSEPRGVRQLPCREGHHPKRELCFSRFPAGHRERHAQPPGRGESRQRQTVGQFLLGVIYDGERISRCGGISSGCSRGWGACHVLDGGAERP